ncbi:MAG: hypothetical protein JW708_11070, partial [Vallitaleaceae bacterium]|nr:hypothetical protein [Vallitaleaceae bacterium]
RETFLMPLSWHDDWPYVSESKKSLLKVEGPIWAKQETKKDFIADFQDQVQQEEWMYLRNPTADSYRWSKGKLELCPSKIRFADKKNPTFIGLRQSDFNCCVEADVLFEPMFVGSEAGLVILLASEFHYRIAIRKNGDKKEIFVYKKAEDFEQCAKVLAISEGITQIRVEAVRDKYSFYYQDSLLCTASTRFLACEVFGRCFTGTLIGLYAYSEEERERRMEVHRFTLSNNPAPMV